MIEVGTKAGYVDMCVADGTTMRGYFARPEGGKAYPSLLVFQEAFGVNRHIRNVVEQFARRGFVAIAPELFHRTGPGFEGEYTNFEPVRKHMAALTDEGMEADEKAAIEWLLRENSGQPVACVGYCMGGRASFLAATHLDLKAAVSYYGGGIAPSERGPGLLGRIRQMNCPILMFWGGQDQHIPPCRFVRWKMRSPKRARISLT